MLRFVTLRHYCGLTPPPTSVPGSSTFVTECGECSIGCKAAPPPPARPNLLQGSICWTHLPNSVNLVKARLLPDMGLLSKPRTSPPHARTAEHPRPAPRRQLGPWLVRLRPRRPGRAPIGWRPQLHDPITEPGCVWKSFARACTRGLVVTRLDMKIGV